MNNAKGVLTDLALGGLATLFSKTAAAPFARIKLLLQNQNELRRTGRLKKRYSGIMDCLGRIIKTEGFSALWRGQSINILMYIISRTFYITFNGYFNQIFTFSKKNNYWKWFAGYLTSSSLKSVASSVLLYPLHFAQTQLASDVKSNDKHQYDGVIDVLQKTIASDGITGLYSGLIVSSVGSVLSGCFVMSVYQLLFNSILITKHLNGSYVASFVTSWTTVLLADLISFPMDTISKRMIVSMGTTKQYKNGLDTFTKIVRREGLLSLFNGFGANILRTIVGGAASVCYDKVKQIV